MAAGRSPVTSWAETTAVSTRPAPGFLVLAALLVALPGPRGALAQAKCSKADFEAVVDDAAGALRGLAQQNTPQFQAKLRQLKVKRGWSDDQLLKEAEPLVRD